LRETNGGCPINHQPKTINLPNFSVKEKDEASLSNGFRQGLLNAFILHFAEVKAFLFWTRIAWVFTYTCVKGYCAIRANS
jgi:hypothetical protein